MRNLSPQELEIQVRRIASQLWSDDDAAGAVMLNGKETDGYYVTREMVHIIECTVSNSKEKADFDCKKLLNLSKSLQSKYPDKGIKTWFITLSEPTIAQKEVAKKYKSVALSYHQFQHKLIDTFSYINLRDNYAFGSARDLETGSIQVNESFISVDLLDIENRNTCLSIEKVVRLTTKGNRFVIIGQYGVGKSMALKEIYKFLTEEYKKNGSASKVLIQSEEIKIDE